MKAPILLLSAGLLSCKPAVDATPYIATTVQAIKDCGQPIKPDGTIDQATIAKAGWKITSRKVNIDNEERDVPIDSYPPLKGSYEAGEYFIGAQYERTLWTYKGAKPQLALVRHHVSENGRSEGSNDYCSIRFDLNGGDAEKVSAGLVGHFGKQPDKAGNGKLGGDFLLPRFDKEPFISYWELPQHNIFLRNDGDGQLSVDIIAIPDRTRLDPSSADHPDNRIPSGDKNI